MLLLFLYGPVASGKLTIGRLVAERTGIPLFHNHLIVDAVSAVFPFGSEPFVRLREGFWLEMMGAAAQAGRSLIFTFTPEPTVAEDFPERARSGSPQPAGGCFMSRSIWTGRSRNAGSSIPPAERSANFDRRRSCASCTPRWPPAWRRCPLRTCASIRERPLPQRRPRRSSA